MKLFFVLLGVLLLTTFTVTQDAQPESDGSTNDIPETPVDDSNNAESSSASEEPDSSSGEVADPSGDSDSQPKDDDSPDKGSVKDRLENPKHRLGSRGWGRRGDLGWDRRGDRSRGRRGDRPRGRRGDRSRGRRGDRSRGRRGDRPSERRGPRGPHGEKRRPSILDLPLNILKAKEAILERVIDGIERRN